MIVEMTKYAVNSTVGTPEFETLDRMIKDKKSLTHISIPKLITPSMYGYKWTQKAAVPTSMNNLPAAAHNGRIYVFSSAATYIYDTVSDAWQPNGVKPPGGAAGGFAVIVNGKAYLVDNSNQTQIYDIEANTWSYGANALNVGYGFTPAFAHDGFIYSFGSGGGVRAYNIAANSWASRQGASDALGNTSSALIGGRIYFFGSDTRTRIYDIASNKWLPNGASAPSSMALSSAVAFNGKAYVFNDNLTQIYDVESNTWSTGISTQPANGARAVFTNGAAYLLGDNSSYPNDKQNQQFRILAAEILISPVSAGDEVWLSNGTYQAGGQSVPGGVVVTIAEDGMLMPDGDYIANAETDDGVYGWVRGR